MALVEVYDYKGGYYNVIGRLMNGKKEFMHFSILEVADWCNDHRLDSWIAPDLILEGDIVW